MLNSGNSKEQGLKVGVRDTGAVEMDGDSHSGTCCPH